MAVDLGVAALPRKSLTVPGPLEQVASRAELPDLKGEWLAKPGASPPTLPALVFGQQWVLLTRPGAARAVIWGGRGRPSLGPALSPLSELHCLRRVLWS